MNKWILLILPTLFLVACSTEDTAIDETITMVDSEAEDASAPILLEIAMNTVNIRKLPSMDSPVVVKLAIGTKVEWQNQLSEVTAPVKLRGVRYNDPWLYINTTDNQTGWVYAATVSVNSKNKAAETLKQKLFKRRVNSFFGEKLSTSISNYNQAYAQANTSERFANVYGYGQSLRDQLVAVLDKKAFASVEALADMSWLDSVLTGYTQNIVTGSSGASKKHFYLSADYQQLSKKAQRTEGDEDDQFIAFVSSVFVDGKETPFIKQAKQVEKATLAKLNLLKDSLSFFKHSLSSLKNRLKTQK